MSRSIKWLVAITSGAGVFVLVWWVCVLIGRPTGDAIGIAAIPSALVTTPLAWWAGRDSPHRPTSPSLPAANKFEIRSHIHGDSTSVVQAREIGELHIHPPADTDTHQLISTRDPDFPSKRGHVGPEAYSVGLVRDAVRDALLLGVHRSITVEAGPNHEPPPYVVRGHDRLVRQKLAKATSGPLLTILVGDSCTGKTRAAMEAIATCLPDWPLVYPRTSDELLLATVDDGDKSSVSNIVIWLDEMQQYFSGDNVGQVTARLHRLLAAQRPLAIVGTMWPMHWTRLTTQPDSMTARRDEFFHERQLLKLADPITIPAKFDATALQRAERLAKDDARLRTALAAAHNDGKVVQCLAGGPELVDCYVHGRSFTKVDLAVITAALDARRLGHNGPIPRTLLEQATPGYLDPDHRVAGDDWFERSLARINAVRVKGAITALREERTSPGLGCADAYNPADYLDQYARRARAEQPCPATLWDALVTNTEEIKDLSALARQAANRGHYRHAAHLWIKAADLGSIEAESALLAMLVERHRIDEAAMLANSIANHIDDISVDDPLALWPLLDALTRVGYASESTALAARIAKESPLSNMSRMMILANMYAFQRGDASAILSERLAEHIGSIPVDDRVVTLVLGWLKRHGEEEAAKQLALRIAHDCSIDDPDILTTLDGIDSQAALILAERIASRLQPFPLDWPPTVYKLFKLYKKLQLAHAADALAARVVAAAVHIPTDSNPRALANLLTMLKNTNQVDAARSLVERIAGSIEDIPLNDHAALATLIRDLEEAHGSDAAAALARRVAIGVPIGRAGDLFSVMTSLGNFRSFFDHRDMLQDARHPEAALTLVNRIADQLQSMPLDDAVDISTTLLKTFLVAERQDSVGQLISRMKGNLDDVPVYPPSQAETVIFLLGLVGETEAAKIFARRAAENLPLVDDRRQRLKQYVEVVKKLGRSIERTGVPNAQWTLSKRAAGAGLHWGVEWMIEILRAENRNVEAEELQMFGREPEATITPQWRIFLHGASSAGSKPRLSVANLGGDEVVADDPGEPIAGYL